jgi:hypothetical protein
MSLRLPSEGLARFVATLRAGPQRRIDWKGLWRAFADAFPKRPHGPEEREWLLGAIQHAVEQGVITLPSLRGKLWDRTQNPALPLAVSRVVAPVPTRDQSWRRFPWHRQLAWVSSLPVLSEEHEAFLLRVHEGLRDRAFAVEAPLRYRSLQLTGQEKRLGDLMKTSLFGPGRLSKRLLGCMREAIPFAWEETGGGGRRALVLENAGPFHVALRYLAENKSPYGVVIYGGGGVFKRSVRYLAELPVAVEAVDYVGDIDWDGLDIASHAQRVAAERGLPPVSAATTFHGVMIATAGRMGHPNGWPSPKVQRQRPDALGFLEPGIRSGVEGLVARGHRIPEETLGPAEIGVAIAAMRL